MARVTHNPTTKEERDFHRQMLDEIRPNAEAQLVLEFPAHWIKMWLAFDHRLMQDVEMLCDALREIWDSVPSSYEPDDPMVQRHACALNGISDLLAQHSAKGDRMLANPHHGIDAHQGNYPLTHRMESGI